MKKSVEGGERNLHEVQGSSLQEGQKSILSRIDKFYMVSTLLDVTDKMVPFISPSEFSISQPFSRMEV